MPTIHLTADMTPQEKAACMAQIAEISQGITAKEKEALTHLEAQCPGLLDRERGKAAQEASDKMRLCQPRVCQDECTSELEHLYGLRHVMPRITYLEYALRIASRNVAYQLPDVAASIGHILDGKIDLEEDDD